MIGSQRPILICPNMLTPHWLSNPIKQHVKVLNIVQITHPVPVWDKATNYMSQIFLILKFCNWRLANFLKPLPRGKLFLHWTVLIVCALALFCFACLCASFGVLPLLCSHHWACSFSFIVNKNRLCFLWFVSCFYEWVRWKWNSVCSRARISVLCW